MNNLKEFEVKNLSKVVGGESIGGEVTVRIEGILDGVPNNTKIIVDAKATLPF